MDSYTKIFDRRPLTSYFLSGAVEYTAWKDDSSIKYTISDSYSFNGEGVTLSNSIDASKDISIAFKNDVFFVSADNGSSFDLYSISGETEYHYGNFEGKNSKVIDNGYFSGDSISVLSLKNGNIYGRLESEDFLNEYLLASGIEGLKDAQPLYYPDSGKIGIFCYKNGSPIIITY